jgi:hypothetical protein
VCVVLCCVVLCCVVLFVYFFIIRNHVLILFSLILFRPFNKEITKARAFMDKMPFEKRIKHSIIWKWHHGWMPVRRGSKQPFAWAKSRLVCKASLREWIRDSRVWILKKFHKPWTGSSRYVNVFLVYNVHVYIHHKKTLLTHAFHSILFPQQFEDLDVKTSYMVRILLEFFLFESLWMYSPHYLSLYSLL